MSEEHYDIPVEEEEEAKRPPVKPLEPCRVPTPNTVPVRPGYVAAARRAGCEDEYDNAMQARYGDGW